MVKDCKQTFAVWITPFSLFLLFSCGKAKQTDTSLLLQEYIELGIPNPEKTWDLDEYNRAFKVLSKLKVDHPYALPLKSGMESNEIYNRLVSSNNFNFLQNSSIPLSQKAQAIQVVLRVYGDLLDLYTNVLMKKQYYHQELIGVHLFGLEISEKMLVLADSINESEDPRDEALQYGYQSIQEIYSTIMVDLLKVQKNTEMYLPADLKLLCDSISSSLSLNQHAISNESANEMRALMMEIVNGSLSDHIKDRYTELIGLLADTDNKPIEESAVRESE